VKEIVEKEIVTRDQNCVQRGKLIGRCRGIQNEMGGFELKDAREDGCLFKEKEVGVVPFRKGSSFTAPCPGEVCVTKTKYAWDAEASWEYADPGLGNRNKWGVRNWMGRSS